MYLSVIIFCNILSLFGEERGAKYTFPQLCGLLQEPLNLGLTRVGGTTVKTTVLGSCDGTEQLVLNNGLNGNDHFLPCRCTRELLNSWKTICHEL